MPAQSLVDRLAFATLLLEQPEAHIWVLKLNRPDSANALNSQMGRDLLALFAQLSLEPGETRCVVVTGMGNRAFCAGGDIKERDGMTDAAWLAQHALFEQAFLAVMECPIPLIAAVNGAAYGGGCELALACDFIYAAHSARFAQPETRLGIIPGGGGTQNLSRVVGTARAKEIIFSGLPFDAAQAEKWGMINKVVPEGQLMEAALDAARVIAANAPVAVRLAKLAISNGFEVDRRSGLIIEIAAYNQTVPTSDRREGMLAALERRPPRFTGR